MAFWKHASCPLIELWKKCPFRIYGIHIKWQQINETKNEITELSSKCWFKNYTYGAMFFHWYYMLVHFKNVHLTLYYLFFFWYIRYVCSGRLKILYVKTKELGSLGGHMPGAPPRSANGMFFSHHQHWSLQRSLTQIVST